MHWIFTEMLNLLLLTKGVGTRFPMLRTAWLVLDALQSLTCVLMRVEWRLVRYSLSPNWSLGSSSAPQALMNNGGSSPLISLFVFSRALMPHFTPVVLGSLILLTLFFFWTYDPWRRRLGLTFHTWSPSKVTSWIKSLYLGGFCLSPQALRRQLSFWL